MEWERYKQLADSPNYLSRWMLQQTTALAAHRAWQQGSLPVGLTTTQLVGIKAALAVAESGTPLAKPSDHKGGPATDMLPLRISPTAAQGIVQMLQAAVKLGLRTPATERRGLGGFVEAWQEALAGLTLETTTATSNLLTTGATMSQASSVVLALIDGFNRMDMDAIANCFTDDAVYHNMPMDPVTGKANIRASLEPFVSSATKIQWDLLSIAENDQGHVLTERVDRFEVGGNWIAVEVMGICEVADGKITAWRDYFDLAQFQQQMAGATA